MEGQKGPTLLRQQSVLEPVRGLDADLPHQEGNIAILTSGGDSQGMNAAVRAVVRVALHRGLSVYAVQEGYYGLIQANIRQLCWSDVAGILQQVRISLQF